MPLRRRRWTEADIANLRRMAGNYSKDQIANILGRGRPAVAVKAHELGISLNMRGRPSETGADPGAAGMDF
jgi:hypothetical protein